MLLIEGVCHMSQEIEIEYKNLITKEEYNQLLAAYSFQTAGKKQINYYFETKNKELREHGCALRIREKENTYTLTLKEPRQTGLLETHDIIQKDVFQKWINGDIIPQPHTSKQFKNLGVKPKDLVYMGSLETIRREATYKNVLLVLDISRYNNKIDYELELEAPDESTGSYLFEKILNNGGIPKRNTPNKIKRFYTSL